MASAYNKDGVKTELTKEINRKKAFLQAWENVTFPTKKDGTPFKQMSKNIAGATYCVESYSLQPGECMVKVHTWADGTGYVSSSVRAHELVEDMKDETKLAKTQNYQPKQTWLKQVYTYDLDDIKKEIEIKIASLKAEIAELEVQLAIAEEVFDTFRNAYAKAIAELEQTSRKNENSTLYYMVLDTIKSRYPYC